MAKILVIEDQLAVRGLLVDILVSDGHEVLAVADGRMGLELHARHRPVLVITDLLIPEAARLLGATVTLAKPFSVNQVLTAVRQLLGDGPPA